MLHNNLGINEKGHLTFAGADTVSLAEKYGHQTVGTKVDISHLKACRPGAQVTITAELLEVEGRRLEFHVKAEDASGLLGEGKHQRYIIDPERFMSKLA